MIPEALEVTLEPNTELVAVIIPETLIPVEFAVTFDPKTAVGAVKIPVVLN